MYGEIKSGLNLGSACCHSVQNLLSASLLSKSVHIEIYRTTILPRFIWVRNLASHIVRGTKAEGCLRTVC